MRFVAILVATALSAGLGAAWYSPALFGNAWMRELGKTPEPLGPPAPAIVGSVVSCFVAACAVMLLVDATGSHTLLSGARLGALLAFGIVAMMMLSDALFSGWTRWLYWIQLGYRASSLVLMGALLGAWPR